MDDQAIYCLRKLKLNMEEKVNTATVQSHCCHTFMSLQVRIHAYLNASNMAEGVREKIEAVGLHLLFLDQGSSYCHAEPNQPSPGCSFMQVVMIYSSTIMQKKNS